MLLRRHRRRQPTKLENVLPKVNRVRYLEDKTVLELREMAREVELEGYSRMNKSELIKALE